MNPLLQPDATAEATERDASARLQRDADISNLAPAPSLEHSLLTRMLKGDLEIAARMLDIGDYVMADNALRNAATKLSQLRVL